MICLDAIGHYRPKRSDPIGIKEQEEIPSHALATESSSIDTHDIHLTDSEGYDSNTDREEGEALSVRRKGKKMVGCHEGITI